MEAGGAKVVVQEAALNLGEGAGAVVGGCHGVGLGRAGAGEPLLRCGGRGCLRRCAEAALAGNQLLALVIIGHDILQSLLVGLHPALQVVQFCAGDEDLGGGAWVDAFS